MKILVLGSGAREHAVAWRLSEDVGAENVFTMPGNAGIPNSIKGSISDFSIIKHVVISQNFDMVFCGPEQPLAEGLADFFMNDNDLCRIPFIGPSQQAAMLESSKAFSKNFMKKHQIPTAAFGEFDVAQIEDAKAFLKNFNPPYVIKADGLAAGKGVVIIDDLKEAENHLEKVLQGHLFGNAGSKVVIEEFLDGIEVSVFVALDGKSYVVLPEAKDYKRIFNDNVGPNTGGMGSVSPVPFYTKEFETKVIEQIIKPTVNGLIEEKIDYRGFLFIGIINVKGNPLVIEYNVRLGDPETQVVMMRLKSSFASLLGAIHHQTLNEFKVEHNPQSSVNVVIASEGYPGDIVKGNVIQFKPISESNVFHAGTEENSEQQIINSGGRVLSVCSLGNTLSEAQQKSYRSIKSIYFKGMQFRTDIGNDLIGE